LYPNTPKGTTPRKQIPVANLDEVQTHIGATMKVGDGHIVSDMSWQYLIFLFNTFWSQG
jgi:hypothetical protein